MLQGGHAEVGEGQVQGVGRANQDVGRLEVPVGEGDRGEAVDALDR